MEKASTTALVSAFSRAYHSLNKEVKIFDDSIAAKLLSAEEYAQISKSMAGGIAFFNPAFEGTEAEALRWVVDNQLSPSPLGRAAFAEKALEVAVKLGARQYLILGAGLDSFALRQPAWAARLEIFELDTPLSAADKRERMKQAGLEAPENLHCIEADFTKADWQRPLLEHERFDGGKISFCSALGLAYYLPQESFEALLDALSELLPRGGAIAFDYPDEFSYTEKAGERAKKQALLAGGAKEKMLASYSYSQLEALLSERGFLIYEHLTPPEITEQYFKAYNVANPDHPMSAFDNVSYCLAVKR